MSDKESEWQGLVSIKIRARLVGHKDRETVGLHFDRSLWNEMTPEERWEAVYRHVFNEVVDIRIEPQDLRTATSEVPSLRPKRREK